MTTRHLHRPGEVVSERYANGQRLVVRQCEQCSETLPEKKV